MQQENNGARRPETSALQAARRHSLSSVKAGGRERKVEKNSNLKNVYKFKQPFELLKMKIIVIIYNICDWNQNKTR